MSPTKAQEVHLFGYPLFLMPTRFEVGNGEKIRFQEDVYGPAVFLSDSCFLNNID